MTEPRSQSAVLPAYRGSGIVNLMSSIAHTTSCSRSTRADRLDAASHFVAPQGIVHSAFNVALKGSGELHAFTTFDELLAKTAAIVRRPGRKRYVPDAPL